MRGDSCWYSHESTDATAPAFAGKGKSGKGSTHREQGYKGAQTFAKGKGNAKGKKGKKGKRGGPAFEPMIFMNSVRDHPDELYSAARAAKHSGDTPLAIELLFMAIQIDATMGPEFSSRSTSRRASRDLEKWALTSEKEVEKSLVIFERVNRRLGLSLESGSEAGFSDDLDDLDDLFGPNYDEDEDEEVVFLRPDGTTESKTVSWCLGNDFFEVRPGVWSGPWYDASHQGAPCGANREHDDESEPDACDESDLYVRAELMEARHKTQQMQLGLTPAHTEAIFNDSYVELESQLQLMQAREYAEKRRSHSQKKLRLLRDVVAKGVKGLDEGDLHVHEEVLKVLLADFKEDADALLVANASCNSGSVERGSAIDYVHRMLSLHARLHQRLLTDVLDLVGYWCDVPFCRTLLVRQGLLQLLGGVLDRWPVCDENSAGIRLKALEALPQVIVDRDSHTQAVSAEGVALLRGLADSACHAEQPLHQFYALSIAANGLGNPGTGLARALLKQGLLGPAILLEHAGGRCTVHGSKRSIRDAAHHFISSMSMRLGTETIPIVRKSLQGLLTKGKPWNAADEERWRRSSSGNQAADCSLQ